MMKEKKTMDFVGAIFGAIIGLAIVNTVPLWLHLTNGVVLESWVNILWAANLSMAVQIAGNLMLAVYRPARLYAFIQAVFAATGLIGVIVFYTVFPLDFSVIVGNWLNLLTKAVLIIAMVGTSISIVVHLVRTVLGTQYTPAVQKAEVTSSAVEE
jgi:hypothetical protein